VGGGVGGQKFPAPVAAGRRTAATGAGRTTAETGTSRITAVNKLGISLTRAFLCGVVGGGVGGQIKPATAAAGRRPAAAVAGRTTPNNNNNIENLVNIYLFKKAVVQSRSRAWHVSKAQKAATCRT